MKTALRLRKKDEIQKKEISMKQAVVYENSIGTVFLPF